MDNFTVAKLPLSVQVAKFLLEQFLYTQNYDPHFTESVERSLIPKFFPRDSAFHWSKVAWRKTKRSSFSPMETEVVFTDEKLGSKIIFVMDYGKIIDHGMSWLPCTVEFIDLTDVLHPDMADVPHRMSFGPRRLGIISHIYPMSGGYRFVHISQRRKK